MSKAPVGVLLASMLAVGCADEDKPPLGQVLLYIDTDAPVPLGPGKVRRDDDPMPLFDRLLVEVLKPDEPEPCAGCVREFAVDSDQFAAREVSLGIPLPPGIEGYRARVTLFRAALRWLGEPPPEASLQAVLALPALEPTGLVELSVTLYTDEVGRPMGTLEQPAQPAKGPVSSSLVGTWRGATHKWCTSAPRENEVCVPGGAYWMGTRADGGRERLVLLRPFFIDKTELTVGQLRASGFDTSQVLRWSQNTSGMSDQDYCTYTQEPGAREDYPVNCISWPTARAYCQSRGMDLPSGAQLEYVLGAMQSLPYVWGREEPTCTDAVYGRGGFGAYEMAYAPCQPLAPPGGPLNVHAGARDRLVLPGGVIEGLVGNVSEWTLDTYQPDTAPFWQQPTLYEDPVSTEPNPSGTRMLRGANWSVSLIDHVQTLKAEVSTLPQSGRGVRCVRADEPP